MDAALARLVPVVAPALAAYSAGVGVLDGAYAALADFVGAPADYVKLFSLLILALPLAAPLPHLPPRAKHLANIAVSGIFMGPVLHIYGGYLQLLASAALTYVLVALGVGGRRMPWIVMFFQMGHLLVNHLVRQFGNIPITTVEITSMQMVMVMNLTTFAWDCYDGQRRPLAQLDAWQRKSRISAMPSLLEFFGYVFYFPGFLIGPATRFVDYQAWAEDRFYHPLPTTPVPQAWGSEDASRLALSQESAPMQKSVPAGRWPRAARQVITGFIFTGLFLFSGSKYDYMRLTKPVAAGGVSDLPFGRRMLFIQLAGFMARTKYYGVWSLTDGACVASGLGFNGYAPAPPSKATGTSDHWVARWDRCLNVDILHIELANNWKEVLDHWNINTNIWLRNNVYKRLVPPGTKPGFSASMFTFLTSAFWHGVAPGYYLAFVLAGLFSALAKNMRRHLRPLFFEDPHTPNPSLRRARARRAQAKALRDKLLIISEELGSEGEEQTAKDMDNVLLSAGVSSHATGDFTPSRHMVEPFPLPSAPDEVPSLRQLLSDPNLFTSVGPRYTKSQLIYSTLSVVATQATLNFTVAPFLVLDWHSSTKAYAAGRWYGLWIAIAGLVAFQLGLGRVLDRLVKQFHAREQAESQPASGAQTPEVVGTTTAVAPRPAGEDATLRQASSNPLPDMAGQASDEGEAKVLQAQALLKESLDK